jgi:hypothetical protein
LVWGLGAVASIFRNASARRLFSFGDTIRPPSVRSVVFSISLTVLASVDLADRHLGLAKRLAKCLCQRLALFVEIALRSDVVEVKRIGIGLIRESGAVADDDDKIARAQGLRDILIVRVCRRDGHHEHAE